MRVSDMIWSWETGVAIMSRSESRRRSARNCSFNRITTIVNDDIRKKNRHNSE